MEYCCYYFKYSLCFLQFFFFFFFTLINICCTSYNRPMVLEYFVYFFILFFFTFLLQKFLLTFLQTHCFFSQSCPVYWWGHQISVKGSISTISFWLFLIHPSVYITNIFFCMSTFLIRALSLLIILVLNSQCDNSKTSLLLESGSDD